MFDIGFWELLLVLLVLLLITQPKDLPKMIRQIVRGVAKAKQGIYATRAKLERELYQAGQSPADTLKQEMDALERLAKNAPDKQD